MQAIENKRKLYIAKRKAVRLFDGNLLEWASTCHHIVPFIIFIPTILFFSGLSIYYVLEGYIDKPLYIIPLSIGAILLWTIIEYTGHRYVFHYNATSTFGKRMLYVIHWAHHDYPDDTKRLVVPPLVTVPAGILLYYLSYLAFGYYAAPFFTVLVSSYLIYDWCHFACHHLNFKNPYFQKIKKHHLRHHYKDPDHDYGFTTTLWDDVLKTRLKI
tara:strand:+ start:1508 stop:2149 length:642 start_codon:yes stop_codon:yes gene_type:complete